VRVCDDGVILRLLSVSLKEVMRMMAMVLKRFVPEKR